MYFMSDKAVGTDWKRSSIYTLRHAAANNTKLIGIPDHSLINWTNSQLNDWEEWSKSQRISSKLIGRILTNQR